MKKFGKYGEPFFCLLWNFVLALILMEVTRVVFILMNRDLFPSLDFRTAAYYCYCGLRFDIPTILTLDLPYIVMAILPLRIRSNRIYALVAKFFYVSLTFFCLLANLADSVYFSFTNRRTTWSFFSEFSNESNLATICIQETLRHWYLIIIGLALLTALVFLFRKPVVKAAAKWQYYLVHTLIFASLIFPIVVGMRGTLVLHNHPITTDIANLYVKVPIEGGIVLNTPFSLYKTIDTPPFRKLEYFTDEAEMLSYYKGPEHPAVSEGEFRRKNVCVLILESFSASYSSYLTSLQGKEEEGYMPFVDSLMRESYMFRYSFANGHKSIEAMPSLLSGIPSMVEPFVLTRYFTNSIGSIPLYLREKGYCSAFFHGAPRGSMGFEAFTNVAGIERCYNMETFGDRSKFDGTWAIYDEPFLAYTEREMTRLEQPFVATIFTASSHAPFVIPKEYDGRFKGGSHPMYKAVEYADWSVRKFFEAASKEEWYANTVFIISGDHASVSDRPQYTSTYGSYMIPLFVYTPDGSLTGLNEGVAQQCDMVPTLMDYLNYPEPVFSFGQNLLRTPEDDLWAFNYVNGCYQYFKGEWCLQFNGSDVVGLFDFKHDRLQQNNCMESHPEVVAKLLPELKSLIQQYMERMIDDRLTVTRSE